MKLITKSIALALRKNKRLPDDQRKPVLKLFTPDASATWLISEFGQTESHLFGLCDLGHGCVELGIVSLPELEGLRGPMGLKVERDRFFTPDKTLLWHAEDGRKEGGIAA